jgi:hypothetical protein
MSRRTASTAALLIAAVLTLAFAADDKKARDESKDAAETARRLDRIKKLAGAWEGKPDEEGAPAGYVYYRVISAGSAVGGVPAAGDGPRDGLDVSPRW